MKKIVCALSLISLLLLVPHARAWGWGSHYDIVDVAYDALPENLRVNLDLAKIKEGVVAPDRWGDWPHTYPEVYSKAIDALEKARDYFHAQRYADASYYLGVAGHYIQIMVCLPHCVYGETEEQHVYFESTVAETLSPKQPALKQAFDLEWEISSYKAGAQEKWNAWLETHDQSYVQEGLDLAASLTYNAWYEVLTTAPEKRFQFPIVTVTAIILGLVVVVLVVKRYKM